MSLQMSKTELKYHRKNFYETMKNHGTPCKIYSIHDNHEEAYDFYNDIKDTETSYDGFIETLITYEELPKIKTLKSLGWYIEDETFPAVGYIPVLYQDKYCRYANFRPNIDDKVVITVNPYDDNPSTRSFLIKDFLGNGFPSTIYYTVKLVPYREDDLS